MKKKLYLTKKRKAGLQVALSIDDVMYRMHEQMQEQINKYAKHLEKTYKKVVQVRSVDINGNLNIEQVIDVKKIDGEGLIVTIHSFK